MLDEDVPTAWQESVAYAHKAIDHNGIGSMLKIIGAGTDRVVRSSDSRSRWQWDIPDLGFVQKAGAAFHALAYALASGLPHKAGTTDYYQYIRSPEWRIRRQWMFYLADYRCQLCNAGDSGTGLNVHHRTYENLYRELPCDLTVLCRTCHAKFHGKQ